MSSTMDVRELARSCDTMAEALDVPPRWSAGAPACSIGVPGLLDLSTLLAFDQFHGMINVLC